MTRSRGPRAEPHPISSDILAHVTPSATSTPKSFEQAWEIANGVEGWLSREQGLALFEAARAIGPGEWIVEIGSHRGRSTVLLAAGKGAHVRLLAVDPFDDPRWGGGRETLAMFEDTLRGAGLLDEVQTFRGLSVEAAAAATAHPVGLLFVDGAHDRASVLLDIDCWTPHLAPQAVLLFHDAYSSPGVTVALFERFLLSRRARYRGCVASLARIDHGPERSARSAVSATLMMARLPWFARNLLIKLALRRRWPAIHRALGHPGTQYPY